MHTLINIDVDDLDRAVQFYVSAFGLRAGRRFGADGVEMLGAPVPVYLLLKAPGSVAAPGLAQKRTYERHWTPVHLDFVVENIDSAVEQASSAGAMVVAQVTLNIWGKLAVLADPFGHGFCFIEFTGLGYDEIAD